MTTFSAITAGQIDAESFIDTVLAGQWANNVLAMFEGDASASAVRLQAAGLEQAGGSEAVITAVIRASAITEAELAANSVHQSEVAISTETDTTNQTTPTAVVLTSSVYLFVPLIKSSFSSATGSKEAGTNGIMYTIGTTYGRTVYLQSSNLSYTTTLQQNYISASRPYELNGERAHGFICAIIDGAGKIETMKVAEDPIWIYNGPTKVTADSYGKGGEQFIKQFILPPSLQIRPNENASDLVKQTYMIELADFHLTPEFELVELTPAMKNVDMNIIPHPYLNNDLTGKTVVMIDPISLMAEKLMALHRQGEAVNDLFHDGFITLGQDHIERGGPQGLMVVSAGWK